MATFKAKFNLGDKVYYVSEYPSLEEAEEISELFDSTMDGISCGTIQKIEFSDANPVYLVAGNKFKEDCLFATQKEAYFEAMTNLRDRLQHLFLNAETILKTSKDSFEENLKEYQNNH